MREFKFRAWDDVAKKMYLPEELEQENVFSDLKKTIYSYLSFGVLCIYDFRGSEPIEFLPLQFTGCYDVNRKEVYEGDLVKFNDVVHQVIWDEEYASFALLTKEGGMLLGGQEWNNSAQVIGDIYRNPELWEAE